jgi:hypothetical protein
MQDYYPHIFIFFSFRSSNFSPFLSPVVGSWEAGWVWGSGTEPRQWLFFSWSPMSGHSFLKQERCILILVPLLAKIIRYRTVFFVNWISASEESLLHFLPSKSSPHCSSSKFLYIIIEVFYITALLEELRGDLSAQLSFLTSSTHCVWKRGLSTGPSQVQTFFSLSLKVYGLCTVMCI